MTRQVSALNKMGVKNLQIGRFQEAILSFRHAIEVMKSNTSNFKCAMESGLKDSTDGFCLDRITLGCHEEPDDTECSPHNTFDLFSCAFGLPKIKSVATMPIEISLVLLYNLGLAYHMSGLFHQENSSHKLSEAHRCYTLSLALFEKCIDSEMNPSCYAVICANLNNMGHILSHLLLVEEAQACAQHLQVLLDSPEVTVDLTEEEAQFFFLTCSYVQNFRFHAAPAA